MAETPNPPIGIPTPPPGPGGGSEVTIDAASIADLADAIASQIAGEALTVNATISSEVEVKNDSGSPVPVSGNVAATVAGVATAAAQATELAALLTIMGYVDNLEGLTADVKAELLTANAHLVSMETRVDGLEGLVGTTNTTLGTIDTHIDGLETLGASSNTKLDTLHADLDGVEGSLTTLIGHVDGLEGLIGSTNTKLDTLIAKFAPIVAEAIQTGDGAVATPGTFYRGFSIKETTALAVAYVTIHDGASAAAPVIEHIDLLANESRSELIPAPGIAHSGTLWVEVQSGAASITVRTS